MSLHVRDPQTEASATTPSRDPLGDEARLAQHCRDLGRVSPVLAHDLLGFLNSMVLNLELLQRVAAREEIDDESAARIRGLAAVVAKEEIPPLDRMLKAVVAQIRLEDPPTTRFDFRALSEELAIVFGSYARHRHLKYRTTLADVPMPVVGDRDAVRHALTSIFLASIDALPQGAELAVAIQADRRMATLTLATDVPAPWAPKISSGPASISQRILELVGARRLDSFGPDGGAVMDITLPLAPLGA